MAVQKMPTLFLYVSPDTKKRLTELKKHQVGKISYSTMVEKILQGALRNPKLLKEFGV